MILSNFDNTLKIIDCYKILDNELLKLIATCDKADKILREVATSALKRRSQLKVWPIKTEAN